MLTDIKKINGCLLGGALGDAFGAPLEATRHLSEIRAQFGPNGMQEFVSYEPQWGDTDIKGLGAITDDTTMLACTLAGVIDAVKNPDMNPAQASWPYYLAWGQHQRSGTAMKDFLQTAKISLHICSRFCLLAVRARERLPRCCKAISVRWTNRANIAKPLITKSCLLPIRDVGQ